MSKGARYLNESTWILGNPDIWSLRIVVAVDKESDLSYLAAPFIQRRKIITKIESKFGLINTLSSIPTIFPLAAPIFVFHQNASKPIPPRLVKRLIRIEAPHEYFGKFRAQPDVEAIFRSWRPKCFPWSPSDFCS